MGRLIGWRPTSNPLVLCSPPMFWSTISMTKVRVGLLTLLAFGIGTAAGIVAQRRVPKTPFFIFHDRNEGIPAAFFNSYSVQLEAVQDALDNAVRDANVDFTGLDARRKLARNVARTELIAQYAESQGFLSDPILQRELKRITTSLFMSRQLANHASFEPDEIELRKYYEKDKSLFVRPERVQIAHLFLSVSGSGLEREAKRKKAQALLANVLKAEENDVGAFEKMAQKYSESPSTRSSEVALPMMTRSELASALGPEVAEAAFALERAPKTAERLLEAPLGLYLIRLKAREEGREILLEEAKPQLKQRIIWEKRGEAAERVIGVLEQKGGLEIQDSVLEKLRLPPPKDAPRVMPGNTTGPGTQPRHNFSDRLTE
jgi:parvulin-like peptidyl-prolyl isomerase